ncbi:hypothetical protein [Mycobacterium sp. SMC-13]|uniref:hypothetical protein n=1 Tax=Mycobacterium sp. SMC-13 TaxID=3381626 RepID=UPI003876B7C5
MKLTDTEVEQWKRDLDSGDKWREAEAAEVLSQSFASDDTGITLTVCDYLWRDVDRIGDFIEFTWTTPRNLAPQATLTLKGDHHLVPLFRTCTQTMVGITIETAGISEAFYVKRHREKLGPDGVWTHVLELVGIYDILNYLVIWPSWYLPIQSQPFSHAIYAAPICTAIESMAAEQALRIQSGMWEFVNNFLSGNPDVRSYFGTVLQGLKRDGKPSTILKTPLYVVRTGLLRDSSQVYVKTVRMQTVGQIITEITAAYGVDVRVHLWRPGDPQPDQWANLEVPTYVMTVRDRTQIEGPTKSILDSALRLVVDVQGSLLGNTLSPLLNPDGKYAPEGLYIAPRLGINFVMPYAMIVTPDNVITEDGDVVRERSPLVSCEIAHNTPLGWQHIIGGKSPKWLVCAPRATGGRRLTSHLERSHQRILRLRHRRGDDRHRIYRCPKQSARRLHERQLPCVPVDRALHAAQQCRPVPPGDRGFHLHKQRAVQRRGLVPVHPSALEQQGLHDGDCDVPWSKRTLQVGPGHLPGRAVHLGLRVPDEALHRLHRVGQRQGQPQHA